MKKTLLKLYYFGNLNTKISEENQEKIRQVEWEAIKSYIKRGSKFLDVGCGSGFSIKKASNELNCTCYGIDPDPGAYGVGRYSDKSTIGLNIKKGFAEKIDFVDESFDIVYCSHVLEHVNDEIKSLREMQRVLKKDGMLIIGMPTSSMAWVNFTQIFFLQLISVYSMFCLNIFHLFKLVKHPL